MVTALYTGNRGSSDSMVHIVDGDEIGDGGSGDRTLS